MNFVSDIFEVYVRPDATLRLTWWRFMSGAARSRVGAKALSLPV